MKSRGQNIGKHREVADLVHGLVLVGKFEQIEISERHQDVVRLATDPTTHIDVAVCATRLLLIHVEANTRVAFTTSTAAPTGHIKWNGYQVADVDKQHVFAFFDDFAQDLVPQHDPFVCSGSATHHMLV